MKKLLLTLLLFFSVGIAAHAQEDNPLVIDFSDSVWKSIGTASNTNTTKVTYSGQEYTVKNCYWYQSKALFMTGGSGYITLPAFDKPVKSIEVAYNENSSTAAVITIYNGTTEVGTTGAFSEGNLCVNINAEESGISYKLIESSAKKKNAQLTKITVTFQETAVPSEPVDFTFFDEYKDNGLSLYKGATLALPANAPSVSYNVEDTNVVDVVDGVLTALAVGETNVTATWSASDAWNASLGSSFKVTVTEAPLEATFDFVNESTTTYATWPSGSVNSLKENGDCSHSIGKITLHVTGRFTIEDSSLKLYKALPNNSPKLDNGTVEISVPTGYYITKVTIDATNPSYFGYTEPFVNEDQTINTKVYTHNGSSGGAYIKAITVEYAEKNGAVDFTFFNPYKESGVTIDVNKEFKFDLPDNAPGVTYTSSDEEIIAVSDDKTFTAHKPGEAIVTASWNAVEGEWNVGSAEIKFVVNGLKPQMRFRDQVVYGKLDKGVVWEPVMVNVPDDAELRGEITYSSSNTEIVTVDSTSGQITKDDIKGAGEVTITATMAAKGNYAEGKASYKIIIIDPEAAMTVVGTSDFDFTEKDAYGIISTSDGGTYSQESVEINEGPVSITIEGKYRSWEAKSGGEVSGYDLRLYKVDDNSGTITVSVPEEYKISKIGVVGKFVATSSPENGGDDNSLSETWDETMAYDWIPSENERVNTVTLTLTAVTHNISHIYVLYEGEDSTVKPAGLSFNNTVYSIYEYDEVELNAVNNPHGLPVTYSIENLDEDEYLIEPSEDGKTIKVMIAKPGYYSLQAKSEPTEDYRDGFAIMRVNVYRHLDLQEITATETKEHKFPDPIYTDEAVKVKIDVPELTTLYYKLVDLNSPTTQADDVESDDENRESGFVEYEDEFINIPANINGDLIFYIAAYGYKSPKRDIPLIHKVAVEEVEVDINDYVLDTDENKFDTNKGEEDLIFTMDVPAGYELHYAVAEGEGEAEYKLYEEPITVAAAHHGSLSFYITRGEYTSETRTISLDGLARLVDEASVTITHHHKFSMVTFEYTFKVENHASAEDPVFEMAVKDVFGNNLDVTEADFTKEEAAPVHVRAAEVAETEPGVKTYTGKIGVEGDDLGDKTKELTAELNVTVKGHPLFSLTKKIDDGMKTGIEDVTVDGAADAEFFTLEGIRVAQPEAGQLYIKRQGGVATKVLVK
ncbi:MAG: Ig-like domain-containing protein [Muribaculaceae bacterium]|nr:Ig-like domain-containing protein [Muribaculaceae bacterium]